MNQSPKLVEVLKGIQKELAKQNTIAEQRNREIHILACVLATTTQVIVAKNSDPKKDKAGFDRVQKILDKTLNSSNTQAPSATSLSFLPDFT